MDRTNPDTSAPDPGQNASSSMSIPPTPPSPSKISEDFVAPGPSKLAPAVDNMDTSGTKPNKKQEVPSESSMGANLALLRLLLSLNNPNIDVNSFKPSEDSSGPPKRTPVVTPSTPLDESSPIGSDEDAALPNTSSQHDEPNPWEFDDQDMSKLCTVLCGQKLNEGILSRYISFFSMPIWVMSEKAGSSKKNVIRHIECLVALLDGSNRNPTLSDFYEAGRSLEGWPKSSTLDDHLNYANDIFWLSIDHFGRMPRLDYLKNISNKMFGRRLDGYNSYFSVTIKQIRDADITFKPTGNPCDHFLFENDVLFLLRLNVNQATCLLGLENNLVAQKVGIGSLGREILSTYRPLLSEDPTWEEAVKIGLISQDDRDNLRDRTAITVLICETTNSPRPLFLAQRERDLIKEIESRKKWWRMLARDIRRQYNTQPFIFYGSVLALLFGVCQIIQTVGSLQALFAPQTPPPQCICPGA